MTLDPFGFVNLRKRAGRSSTQAGAEIKRIYRQLASENGSATKIALGHFGTLDPDAEGVLPLGVGNSTRLFPYITDRTKTYSCLLVLGTQTTTGDDSGEVVETADVPVDAREKLTKAFADFLGERTQIPPMVSALHHEGERLYDLARKGVTVERKPRAIHIRALCFVDDAEAEARNADGVERKAASDGSGESVATFDRQGVAGSMHIRVTCSEGTYVRVLCEDLARAIGTVGHMSKLVREAAGPFRLNATVTAEEVEADPTTALIAPERFLNIPSVTLSGAALARFRHGQVRAITERAASDIHVGNSVETRVLVCVPEASTYGSLVGVGLLKENMLTPSCVLR